MSQFKVVTVPGGITAFKGTDKNTSGVDEQTATARAHQMNDAAAKLGLVTRYIVAPMPVVVEGVEVAG